MIERVIWHPHQLPEELESPFQRGDHERPLRITLHNASLIDLTEQEELAITTIRNLGNLPELDVMEIQIGFYTYATNEDKEKAFRLYSGNVGQIQISPFVPDRDNMAVYSGNSKYFRETYMYSGQFLELTSYLAKTNNSEDLQFQSVLKDLITARSHCALTRDILITKSPNSLNHQKVSFINDANPRTPLGAVRIVGQFLRSRNQYTYKTILKNGRAGVTRGTFYWALVDLKMPHIWYYQNKCKVAGILRSKVNQLEDDTDISVHSAISRCIRAIQALDAIAFNFYVPADDEIRSDMLYHFYYLALLLSGVLDVEAIIAYRAYNVTDYKERNASFNNLRFLTKLKLHGATDLSRIFDKASDGYYLMRLLQEIRN